MKTRRPMNEVLKDLLGKVSYETAPTILALAVSEINKMPIDRNARLQTYNAFTQSLNKKLHQHQNTGINKNIDDQTPQNICKQIIDSVTWAKGESVLEPFAGIGGFYNQLPKDVKKDWCEITKGRDFFEWDKPVDTIITNPPFRVQGVNMVIPCLEQCFKIATKRIIYFINHKTFNSLTPARLKRYSNMGWHITHLSVWAVKKWFGRYYLVIWEQGKPPIVKWGDPTS